MISSIKEVAAVATAAMMTMFLYKQTIESMKNESERDVCLHFGLNNLSFLLLFISECSSTSHFYDFSSLFHQTSTRINIIIMIMLFEIEKR